MLTCICLNRVFKSTFCETFWSILYLFFIYFGSPNKYLPHPPTEKNLNFKKPNPHRKYINHTPKKWHPPWKETTIRKKINLPGNTSSSQKKILLLSRKNVMLS